MDENTEKNEFDTMDVDNTDNLNTNDPEPGNSNEPPTAIDDSNKTDNLDTIFNVENDLNFTPDDFNNTNEYFNNTAEDFNDTVDDLNTTDDNFNIDNVDNYPNFNVTQTVTDTVPNEDNMVGLFEDSDDNGDDFARTDVATQSPTRLEVDPSGQDQSPLYENEFITATLPLLPRPDRPENLVICKFPPTLMVSDVNEIRSFLKSNPHILDHPPNPNNLSVLLYDMKNKSNDSSDDKDSENNPPVSSNGNIVLWDDGTVTLFIGTVPLDVEFQSELSFLFEDSNFDLKPVHAEVDTRLQTRFSNLLKNKMIKQRHTKRQKMEVTFLSDAIQSQYKLQEVILLF